MIREQSIRLPFRYAAGQAGSRFLAALRDDCRILGSKCSSCRRVVCPAQSFCARCGDSTVELVELSSCGTLLSWTELAATGGFGLVLLDGADTAIVHRLVGAPNTWFVGLRVRAQFRAERTGSIGDIEGFAPAKGSAP